MDLLVTDEVWFYLSSHSSSQYMNMGWWKSSCYFTNVITHSESWDAVCCKSLNFLFKLSTQNYISGTYNLFLINWQLSERHMSVFAKKTTYSWKVHGDSTCGTSGQEKVCDSLCSCTYRKKHHDADSSHICREKLIDVASIFTLEEEHFLTYLWLHLVRVCVYLL